MALTRRWHIPALVFALSIALTAATHRSYEPGMIGDDAHYYLGALSLASSGAYRNLSHPEQIPERHFLPGYPLILAPFLTVFPESPTTARWLSGAIFAIAMALMAWLALELLPRRWALIACAWMLFQPITGLLSAAVLSEVPYLCASLGLLLWMLRRYAPDPPSEEANTGAGSPMATIGLATALFAVCWIRPVGFALLAAGGLWLWLRGQRREAGIVGAGGALVIASYLAWAGSGGGEGGESLYTTEFANYAGFLSDGSAWLGAIASKLLYYAVEGTGFFVPWEALRQSGRLGGLTGLALAAVPLLALAAGCAAALRGRGTLLVLYLGAHFGVLLLWPTASIRYLWPLAPVALVLIALGVERFVRARPRLTPFVFAWALFAIGVGGAGQLEMIQERRPMVAGTNPRHTFDWIRDRVEPGAVVAAELPARLTLYTGHPSAPVGNYDRPDTLMQDLLSQGARYLLLVEDQGVQLNVGGQAEAAAHAERARTKALLRDSPLWKSVYASESEGARVLRLEHPPDTFDAAYAAFEGAQRDYQQGKAAEARAALEQALSIDPRLCFARFTLADLLLQAGEEEHARQLLESARDDWPNYPLARFHYGRLLLAQGEIARAHEELRAAVRLAEGTRALEQDRLVYLEAQKLLGDSDATGVR